eukprot:3514759-Prymnesium_polylepis.1
MSAAKCSFGIQPRSLPRARAPCAAPVPRAFGPCLSLGARRLGRRGGRRAPAAEARAGRPRRCDRSVALVR